MVINSFRQILIGIDCHFGQTFITPLRVLIHVVVMLSILSSGYSFFIERIFRRIFYYVCRKLTKELCEVIENYGHVNFTTLDIQVHQVYIVFFICSCQMFRILSWNFLLQDKESVGNLVKLIDKSNGYIFAGIEASAVEFSKIAMAPLDWDYYRYPCFLL